MVKLTQNLADLIEGQAGTIRGIDISSPDSDRLLDMGFVPGTQVKALRKAPMGDPTTFLVRGYQIGLRSSEARLVHIDLHPDE